MSITELVTRVFIFIVGCFYLLGYFAFLATAEWLMLLASVSLWFIAFMPNKVGKVELLLFIILTAIAALFLVRHGLKNERYLPEGLPCIALFVLWIYVWKNRIKIT